MNINLHGLGLFYTNLDEKIAYKHEENWKIFLFGWRTIFRDILISLLSWKSTFHSILISRISGLSSETRKTSYFEVHPLRVSLTMLKRYNVQLLKLHKLLFAQTELQMIQDKAKILIEMPYHDYMREGDHDIFQVNILTGKKRIWKIAWKL